MHLEGLDRRSRFRIHRVRLLLRVDGCVWDSSIDLAFGLDLIVISRVLAFRVLQLESLILAQNERWRQA